MEELNKIQKIIIRQWFNKRLKSPFVHPLDTCIMTDEFYEQLEKLGDSEILSQCIDQYLDELNNAI